MKRDELWITGISAATGLALILYMIYAKAAPSGAPASSAAPYYPAFSGAASPMLAQSQSAPVAPVSINFSPIKLPSLKIPSSSVTINMGSSLFPLFGYAAGGSGGAASGTLAALAQRYATPSAAPAATNGNANYLAYSRMATALSAGGMTAGPYNPSKNYVAAAAGAGL